MIKLKRQAVKGVDASGKQKIQEVSDSEDDTL
jgi:hypothetical protein